MARKKIEQTEEQRKLYNSLVKEVKKANQRILRLERETGLKGSFAVKQLYDYLSSSPISVITKKGRIGLSKSFTTTQLSAIQTAINLFFGSGYSTVREVKSIKRKYSEYAGKPISYKQANVIYTSGRNWSWILGMNGMTSSEFWGEWVPRAKSGEIPKDDWIESLATRIGIELDSYYKKELTAIYIYVIGD